MDAETHHAIAQMLIRYATAIDRRDWDLLASCFTPDVTVDYGDLGAWPNRAALVDHMARGHERFDATLHRISNIVIEGDARSARTTCYVDALLLPRHAGAVRRAIGRYEDVLLQETGLWRIRRHVFVPVLVRDMAG